jgi:hypothetical protein
LNFFDCHSETHDSIMQAEYRVGIAVGTHITMRPHRDPYIRMLTCRRQGIFDLPLTLQQATWKMMAKLGNGAGA